MMSIKSSALRRLEQNFQVSTRSKDEEFLDVTCAMEETTKLPPTSPYPAHPRRVIKWTTRWLGSWNG